MQDSTRLPLPSTEQLSLFVKSQGAKTDESAKSRTLQCWPSLSSIQVLWYYGEQLPSSNRAVLLRALNYLLKTWNEVTIVSFVQP